MSKMSGNTGGTLTPERLIAGAQLAQLLHTNVWHLQQSSLQNLTVFT